MASDGTSALSCDSPDDYAEVEQEPITCDQKVRFPFHGTFQAVVYANDQFVTQLQAYHGKCKHDDDWPLNAP